MKLSVFWNAVAGTWIESRRAHYTDFRGGGAGDRSGLSSRITQESVHIGCNKEAYASAETAITRPWQTRNRSALSTFKLEHRHGVTKYPSHHQERCTRITNVRSHVLFLHHFTGLKPRLKSFLKSNLCSKTTNTTFSCLIYGTPNYMTRGASLR